MTENWPNKRKVCLESVNMILILKKGIFIDVAKLRDLKRKSSWSKVDLEFTDKCT